MIPDYQSVIPGVRKKIYPTYCIFTEYLIKSDVAQLDFDAFILPP